MKPLGILYDNISGNTGDLAIGISVRKMLLGLGYKNDDIIDMIPGISNPDDYRKIIIGGGLLIRRKGDFFYDKYRLHGNHILNSMGIHGDPDDLSYLNQYSYISVRSSVDKSKLYYLAANVNITPCTTLLLDDIKTTVEIKKPSIGIHCFSRQNFNDIAALIKKYSTDFEIYLLPITHYNYDYEFQERIFSHLNSPKVHLLPKLTPLEVFSVIGKFNFFVSYSLHGALFAYRHNIPFLLLNNIHDSKMSAFMSDRGLNSYLFEHSSQLDSKINQLINSPPDYQQLYLKDQKVLQEHSQNIKCAIDSTNSDYPIVSSKMLKQRHDYLENQKKFFTQTDQKNNRFPNLPVKHLLTTMAKKELKLNTIKQVIELEKDIAYYQEELESLNKTKIIKIFKFLKLLK